MKYSSLLVLTFGFLFFQESFAQTSSGNDSTSTLTAGRIYKITEYEASFPGGRVVRNKYFNSFIKNDRKAIIADGTQFCYLKFVVDKEGNISGITINNRIRTKLAEVLIEALKTGPKWNPARQNGAKVNAYAGLTFIFQPKRAGRSPFARNSIKYFITKENEVEKHFEKILILVAGTVPARIFTDHLYRILKIDLNNRGIETEYLFLGNEGKVALENFNNITGSTGVDAILLFIQEDRAKITEIEYGSEISSRSVSLKQSMNIFLMEPGNLDTAVLEAKVFMNFQLQKNLLIQKPLKIF